MELDRELREPIVEKCTGCSSVRTLTIRGVKGEFCDCYLYPETKWRVGNCNRADHLEKGEKGKKVSRTRKKFRKKK